MVVHTWAPQSRRELERAGRRINRLASGRTVLGEVADTVRDTVGLVALIVFVLWALAHI